MLAVALLGAAMAGAGEIGMTHTDGKVAITMDGTVLATYVYNDEAVRRPYIANVTAPDGTPITRPYPPGPDDDHGTMHPGIWLAFGDIDGHDFWRNKAWVRHEQFVDALRNNAFTVRNRYETESGETIAHETCRLELESEEHAVILRWRSTFTPANGANVFGDQEEMGLGFRLAKNLTVNSGNGAILNDTGGKDEDGVWGKPARWCAYTGTLNGNTYGIALISSSENFRPSWMHARDYGLLVANPFGQNAMTGGRQSAIEVTKESPLTLAYTVVIFFGDAPDAEALNLMAEEFGR